MNALPIMWYGIISGCIIIPATQMSAHTTLTQSLRTMINTGIAIIDNMNLSASGVNYAYERKTKNKKRTQSPVSRLDVVPRW